MIDFVKIEELGISLGELGAYAVEGIINSYLKSCRSTDDRLFARNRLWGYQAAMRDLITFEVLGEPIDKCRKISAAVDVAVLILEDGVK